MANSPQARKRARQSENRRQQGASQRSMLRTYLKRVQAAISAGEKDNAVVAYKAAVPVIDRMANRGLLHKNAAARHKSRMNGHIKAL